MNACAFQRAPERSEPARRLWRFQTLLRSLPREHGASSACLDQILVAEFAPVRSHRAPLPSMRPPIPRSTHPAARPWGTISSGGRLVLSSPARLAAAGGFAKETRLEGAGCEAVPK